MIKIKDKEMCSGCYACKNICPANCIDMKNDEEGFKYPKVDKKKCINCKKCVEVCPLINKQSVNRRSNLEAYGAYNKDEGIRMESSSGGIFTLLATRVLAENGVVFGAAWDEDFNLKHMCVESEEELKKLRGSKYLQSKIGNTFDEALKFLNRNRKVIFTGTPCQIGGLLSYISKSNITERQKENLICVDFICHGVPSPKVWEKYLLEISNKNKPKVIDVKFRDKKVSWKNYDNVFLFENNSEYRTNHKENYYMISFLKDIILRPSCHNCGFKGKKRPSDISLADFWGIDKILPDFDDDKGTSLILVHSSKGSDLFKTISNKMEFVEVDVDDALQYNPSAIKSVAKHPKRDEYFKELEKKSIDELYKKYLEKKDKKSVRKKIKFFLKSFKMKKQEK